MTIITNHLQQNKIFSHKPFRYELRREGLSVCDYYNLRMHRYQNDLKEDLLYHPY
jgi:hypothetical protein